MSIRAAPVAASGVPVALAAPRPVPTPRQLDDATVAPDQYRCPRCGVVKPRTSEHFYFDKAGRVTGYCRDSCHRDYLASYWRRGRSEYQKARDRARHAANSRESYRRLAGVTPDRFRGPYRLGRIAS